MPDSLIIFVSPLRRRCRDVQREVQRALAARDAGQLALSQQRLLVQYRVPEWAHGARTVHAGLFQHGVEVTEHRGH